MNGLSELDEIVNWYSGTTEQIFDLITGNWLLSLSVAVFIIGLAIRIIRRIIKLRG